MEERTIIDSYPNWTERKSTKPPKEDKRGDAGDLDNELGAASIIDPIKQTAHLHAPSLAATPDPHTPPHFSPEPATIPPFDLSALRVNAAPPKDSELLGADGCASPITE